MNRKIFLQLGIIFALYWFSQLIEAVLPFSFPASVIALMLLLALLVLRVLKPEQIRESADFLQSGIAFFLPDIPARAARRAPPATRAWSQ